ncbi:MAG: DNA topoisomerase VI subunit B [Desulfurococcales archaeon ex4484_204]|nr:MAG: DNA topoisomerase VI subunit B [Desulfurococcales archaeon ex4484_204]
MVSAITVEKFRELTPSEFFYRNREIAGFSNPTKALYQAIRELIENALDATDSHGILPIVKVYVKRTPKPGIFKVSVEDNGIGIPPHYVPHAFGQLLYSSKYILRQTRGMFGLGAKMAVLYGQMTSGKPVEVVTSPINSSRIYMFKIMIDVKRNRPVVLKRASYSKSNDWHGTMVTIYLEGDWARARSKIYEYIRRTAIIAPYADIVFEDPDDNIVYFRRSTDKMPFPPKEVKPHPYGVDIEMVKLMVNSSSDTALKEFLINEFQGVGRVTAERVIMEAGLEPTVNPRKLKIEEIERLVKVMRASKIIRPPRGDHLSYLGEEIIKTGLTTILKPEFVEAVSRKPAVYEGHAFIVEAGIAYGGSISPAERPMLLRYANKIPLLYDEGSDVSREVIDKKIDWSHYGVTFPSPLVILVHICSTKIPYRGVGKESIADVPEVEREIELAIRDVARKLRSYLYRRRREIEEVERAVAIAKYIPEVSRSLAKIVDNEVPERFERELLKMLNSRLGMFKLSSVYDVVISID